MQKLKLGKRGDVWSVSVSKIVLVMVIVISVYIISRYVAYPLIENFAKNLPEPEPEEVFIDVTGLTSDSMEGCVIVARLSGETRSTGYVRKTYDKREVYMILGNQERLLDSIQYSQKIDKSGIFVYNPAGFLAGGWTGFGQISNGRVVIYTKSFIDNALLKFITLQELASLDTSFIDEATGTTICKPLVDSSPGKGLVAYVDKEVIKYYDGIFIDSGLKIRLSPIGINGAVIYKGKVKTENKVGEIKENKLVFIENSGISAEILNKLENAEIKLQISNIWEGKTRPERYFIYNEKFVYDPERYFIYDGEFVYDSSIYDEYINNPELAFPKDPSDAYIND